MIQAHEPCLTLIDGTKDQVSLIDVSVLWNSRIEKIETEKHKDLRTEPRKLWKMSVEAVPMITGVLGLISKFLKRNLALKRQGYGK